LTRAFSPKLVRVAMNAIPERDRIVDATPLFDVNGGYVGYLSGPVFYAQAPTAPTPSRARRARVRHPRRPPAAKRPVDAAIAGISAVRLAHRRGRRGRRWCVRQKENKDKGDRDERDHHDNDRDDRCPPRTHRRRDSAARVRFVTPSPFDGPY